MRFSRDEREQPTHITVRLQKRHMSPDDKWDSRQLVAKQMLRWGCLHVHWFGTFKWRQSIHKLQKHKRHATNEYHRLVFVDTIWDPAYIRHRHVTASWLLIQC